MKISELQLNNVKCFKNKKLILTKEDTNEPLSVCALVGANGSGKSSILKSIVAAFTKLNPEYGGELLTNEAISFGENIATVLIKLAFDSSEKELLNTSSSVNDLFYGHAKYDEEEAGMGFLFLPNEINSEDGIQVNAYQNFLNNLATCNQSAMIMYYDPFRFVSKKNPAGPNIQTQENAKTHALASNLEIEGNNTYRDLELKQWIVNMDYMRLKEPSKRNVAIYEHMIKAFDLLLSPLKFESISQKGNLEFRDETTKQKVSIDMLSDGFKSIFFIALDVMRRLALAPDFEGQEFYQKEAVILIDEIDCHIHPKWQRKLIPSFKELFPNCQFIITTHSPYILDTLQEYEIIKIGEKEII